MDIDIFQLCHTEAETRTEINYFQSLSLETQQSMSAGSVKQLNAVPDLFLAAPTQTVTTLTEPAFQPLTGISTF